MTETFLPCSQNVRATGVGDGQAHAAAEHDHAVALELGGVAERAGDVLELVALVVGREHLGRLADDHEDELDPALLGVPAGERERDALALLVRADHQELAGMAFLAICGASTRNSNTFSENCVFLRILYMQISSPVLLPAPECRP